MQQIYSEREEECGRSVNVCWIWFFNQICETLFSFTLPVHSYGILVEGYTQWLLLWLLASLAQKRRKREKAEGGALKKASLLLFFQTESNQRKTGESKMGGRWEERKNMACFSFTPSLRIADLIIWQVYVTKNGRKFDSIYLSTRTRNK